MMKMKKLLAVVLALTVALTMGIATTSVAFAADKNDSITVTNAKAGETYSAYKMFDLKVNNENDPTAFTYTVNDGWKTFFANGGDGVQYVTINNAGAVTEVKNAEALAKAAAAWTGKPTAKKSVTVAEGENTAVLSGLDNAYWLVTSTAGNNSIIQTTPAKNAVTISEKNEDNSIEKVVKEDSSGTFGEENDAQIGDTVEFKSTVKIVKGAKNVVVHDVMTTGLTYTANSVAIEGLTKGTDYTVNETANDGCTFEISFAQSWIDGLDFGTEGYKEYVITYTAVLNENAVKKDENGVAIVGQDNKTKVTFGDKTGSNWDTTTTTTHLFSVFKHAKDSTTNLAGATFKVKKNGTALKLIKLDDNNYRIAKDGEKGTVDTFTTVKNGDIVISGVDADSDYSLEETEAPDGYNKLTKDVAITVDAANSTKADVENNAGGVLPSTGGIGTTIFYILGALLVIGCGIVLVARRRSAAK